METDDNQIVFSSVQSLSHVQLFATPCTAECQAFLSITNSWSSLKTHFHWVGDAIQPFHPLSSPTPLAFNLSQHRVFSNESVLCIRWPSIGASVSTSVLPVNIQHWFPLGLIGLIFLQSKGFARVFFNTTVQKYQFFFSAQLSSVLNFLYGPTLTSIRDYWKNHSFD